MQKHRSDARIHGFLILFFSLITMFIGCLENNFPNPSDYSPKDPASQSTTTETSLTPKFKQDPSLPPLPQVKCPPTLSQFQEQIWQPILAAKCLSCHNTQGAAKNTRFVLRLPSEPNHLSKNLQITAATALLVEHGDSVLTLRATGLHPKGHPGGKLLQANTAEYRSLTRFLQQLQGTITQCQDTQQQCDPKAPGQPRIRRLTRIEYDQTIRDVFGFPSTWGRSFVKESVVNGFDNNADKLLVGKLFLEQLQIAADEIASKAVQESKHLFACPIQSGNRNCAQASIVRIGEKLFRAPLKPETINRYRKVYDAFSDKGFEEGMKWVIRTMLESPYFLYRREIGGAQGQGTTPLTPYEIASELSYTFWGTVPDAALLQAAKSGTLQAPKEIEKHARRLMKSPKSMYMHERFWIQVLHIEGLEHTPKDAKIFAPFSASIRKAMMQEFRLFLRHVMLEGTGTLKELLMANYTFVNKELAQFYGIAPPSKTDQDGFGKVTFSDGKRGGLLTLGAVLAVHARPNDSSPIHRGLLIREKFLCQKLPPPPATLDTTPPGLDPKLTTRERYKEHATNPVCAGCHQMIDPIGFGFERFDGIGRYRDTEHGKPIDTSGQILNTPNTKGSFNGVRELATLLANSPDVHQCISFQWMRWVYGITKQNKISCAIQDIRKTFDKQDIHALLLGLTQHPHFRQRLSANTTTPPSSEPQDPQEPNPSDAGDPQEPNPSDAGDPPESTDMESPPPEKAPPPPTPKDLQVRVQTDSDWPEGRCQKVSIKNTGTAELEWRIPLRLEFKMKQHWNANMTPTDQKDTFIFSGLMWNRTVRPQQTVQFGYCLTKEPW